MNLQIQSMSELSKSIIRVEFIDQSNTLTAEHESSYIKLAFNDNSGATKMRSYTIREVNEHIVTIDFVNHGKGLAATWLEQAKIGDVISAQGPGACKLANMDAPWFIFMGDLTAMPAISVNLKKLPKDAVGYVVLEIGDISDIQKFDKPDGMQITWIVHTNPTTTVQNMLDTITNKQWLMSKPYVWVAGEFASAVALRKLCEQKGITERYVSSYWKFGDTDEGNKRAKKLEQQKS